MGQFRINNRLITAPLVDIMKQIRHECGNLVLSEIKEKPNNIITQCPYHGGGNEKTPSSAVFIGESDKTPYGWFHCFACNKSVSFLEFVADCLSMSSEEASEWLCDNFGDILLETPIEFPEIILPNNSLNNKTFLNTNILNDFAYYHTYMQKRKLTKEVVDKFDVGYNPNTNAITFPLRDINGNLIGVSSRNVSNKYFNIDILPGMDKPIYLLDTILKEGYDTVIICESQIDALTAWSYGYVACAMIGVGSNIQYEILNKCPITHYVLMFDNDMAGRKATLNFIKHIRKDVFTTSIQLPCTKKDINDLSKEELDLLLLKYQLHNALKIKPIN